MSVPRVGIIITYDDKYLCVFQDASKLWGFPKGRIKSFESHKDGACRELLEETGIRVDSVSLSEDHKIHIKRGKHHHHYYIKNFNYKPVVTVDGFEIIDYCWYTLDEISNLSISYFTQQVVKRLTTPISFVPLNPSTLIKDEFNIQQSNCINITLLE